MTKKQQNYQLRLAAIAVVFVALAVLMLQYVHPSSTAGVVSGVQTIR